MPHFEVEYSYQEPVFGLYEIEAKDIQEVEDIAEAKLMAEFPAISNPMIESIVEVKNKTNG